MRLKVIPAGDERCDIHNERTPASYICEDCMRELGLENGRAPAVRGKRIRRLRSSLRRGGRRTRRRLRSPGRRDNLLAVAAIAVIVVAIFLIADLTGGGSGGGGGGLPSQEDVVNALGLSPNPSGTGWITLDGACAVLSIQVGARPKTTATTSATTTTATGAGEAGNADGTVRAAVQNAFSQNQTACVDRISAELKAH